MCEALSELGHDVVLVCPKYSIETPEQIHEFYGTKTQFRIEQIPWIKIPGKALLYAIKGAGFVKTFSPDLVISRFLYGAYICSMAGISVIHDLHDKDWEHGRFGSVVFRQLLNRTSLKKLTFNSNGLLRLFKASFPVTRKSLVLSVLFNGAKLFPSSDKIPLPGINKFKAGYFGNLYKGRGIELIIDVAKLQSEIDFIIVGGTPEDIDYWKSQQPSPNIFFLGFVDPQGVYKYRNSVDILLAPYASKVSMAGNSGNSADYMNPIKIFEYMSSGKIIMSSELPAIREVLSERNAVLCDYSVSSWSFALEKIVRNFDDYQIRAKTALDEFTANYSWKARAQRMIS
jgi:glycosyltransferase involved in cell wall biosynthesis